MLSRSKHYQRLFVEKGSPYFKCQTADLSDFRTCMKILDFIGVDINDAEKKFIKTICAEKFNRKSSKKCFEGSPIEDIDIQEAFVMESIDPDGEISDILSLTD